MTNFIETQKELAMKEYFHSKLVPSAYIPDLVEAVIQNTLEEVGKRTEPDFGTKLESIKHIGDMVDGKMVCREDCPSVTHRNTPEEVQRGKGYSQVEITEYSNGEIRANGIPVNTPDTEWETELWGLLYDEYGDVGQNGNIRDFIHNLRTARDTYWKERVRKIAEGMKKNPSKEAEWYGDDAGWEAQGWNNALDTLLDNLK